MTKQEILNAFLQAQKDWERSDSYLCFCFYFDLIQDIPKEKMVILESYWQKHRTTGTFAIFHFHNDQERLQAIKNVIKDLENELGITH